VTKAATLTVFIADDSALLRQVLVATLSKIRGLTIVGEATNGQAATEAIRRLKPQLVILDCHMPIRSGWEALASIKQDSPATVVIMFTAFPSASVKAQCLAAGADYFFDKAAESAGLIETVKKLARELPSQGKPGKS